MPVFGDTSILLERTTPFEKRDGRDTPGHVA
jgi:hypothetical protein